MLHCFLTLNSKAKVMLVASDGKRSGYVTSLGCSDLQQEMEDKRYLYDVVQSATVNETGCVSFYYI